MSGAYVSDWPLPLGLRAIWLTLSVCVPNVTLSETGAFHVFAMYAAKHAPVPSEMMSGSIE